MLRSTSAISSWNVIETQSADFSRIRCVSLEIWACFYHARIDIHYHQLNLKSRDAKAVINCGSACCYIHSCWRWQHQQMTWHFHVHDSSHKVLMMMMMIILVSFLKALFQKPFMSCAHHISLNLLLKELGMMMLIQQFIYKIWCKINSCENLSFSQSLCAVPRSSHCSHMYNGQRCARFTFACIMDRGVPWLTYPALSLTWLGTSHQCRILELKTIELCNYLWPYNKVLQKKKSK
jgi:hypothetical protein